MRRREFIIGVSAAALASPLGARAQHSERVRRIGVLMSFAEGDPQGEARVAAFRQGLEERGWIEGHNLQMDVRWADGDIARIRKNVTELLALAPDVILASGNPNLAAARQAGRSIPIVFVAVIDPVGRGYVSSMARPGGDITGFTIIEYSMIGKSLELLLEAAPAVTRVALLFSPETDYDDYLRSLQAGPHALPLAPMAAHVRSAAEIEAAIAKLGSEPGGGLIVPPAVFTISHREPIIRSAAQHRVPAIYGIREFVPEGGLMAYAPDVVNIYRRSADYIDRILKGAKPADLPVQAPTEFQLVVNLKTATALGLTIPPLILARADEVIE